MTDTDTSKTYAARESWLHAAIEMFRPRFVEIGQPIPERIRVSVGFGPTGATKESNLILGVCLAARCAGGVNEIFIAPVDSDAASMLGTLVHELIHASLDNADGHKGRFADAAVRLGLVGRMTHPQAGLALAADLTVMASELGEYPGATVDLDAAMDGPGEKTPSRSGPKSATQTNRHGVLKCQDVACPCGGYQVRTTKKWVMVGYPMCPSGNEMTEVPES
jgi:hypothetical protein